MIEHTVNEIAQLLEVEKSVAPRETELLTEFSRLVLETNEVMNLTAITEAEEFYSKHIMDSLSLLQYTQGGKRLLDVGSGAGFPGIPLKILSPGLEVVLLDSLQKRIRFLDSVIETLALEKISTLHARAEDAGHLADLRESFDLVTARAVAALPTLLELCTPFLALGGRFLAMKGNRDELKASATAIKTLGVSFVREIAYSLPGAQGERTILEFIKEKPTPKRYPRKAGTPGKQPLL